MKALKEKIEAERGKDNFPVSGQKLIYAGKILQDDTPIKDYNIDEKNFVVVMVSKVSLPVSLSLASLDSVLNKNDVFIVQSWTAQLLYLTHVSCIVSR